MSTTSSNSSSPKSSLPPPFGFFSQQQQQPHMMMSSSPPTTHQYQHQYTHNNTSPSSSPPPQLPLLSLSQQQQHQQQQRQYHHQQHQPQTIRGDQLRQFCEANLSKLVPLSQRLDETITYWYQQNFKQHPVRVLLQKGPFYWTKILYHRCIYMSQKYLFSMNSGDDGINDVNTRYASNRNISPQKQQAQQQPQQQQAQQQIVSARQDLNHTLFELQKWAKFNAELIGILSQCLKECKRPTSLGVGGENRCMVLLNEMVLFFQRNKKNYDKSVLVSGNGYMMISQCGKLIDEHVYQIENYVLPLYKQPNHFTRNWIRYTIGLSVSGYLTWKVFTNRDEIMEWFYETYDTAYRFYALHLQEPVINMYNVIRYDTHRQLVDPESVEVSVNSLERMVTRFALEHGTAEGTPFQQEQLSLIAEQARRGNLDYIMHQYEREMIHPIKNSLFGDMAQLLLIQIQKQKVDIERTMIQMDKLIQSNELNFELMATVPAILLAAFVAYNFFTYQKKTDIRVFSAFKSSLIHTERILNRFPRDQDSGRDLAEGSNPSKSAGITSDDINEASANYNYNQACGFVHVHVCAMKDLLNTNMNKFQTNYRREDSIARDLSFDLTELDDPQLTSLQRLRTVERMYRSYPFLRDTFLQNVSQ